MITRPWGEKVPNVLVDPWTLFGRDSRVVPLFNDILSSAELVSSSGGVPSVSENILASLLLLSQEGGDPIKVAINSRGGSVQAGFTILWAMEHLKASGIEVWTINICSAGSMAGIILAMGTPGRRYVFKDAMTHAHEIQIRGLGGKSTDVEEAQRFLTHQKNVIESLFAANTKVPEYYNKLMDYETSKEKMASLEHRKKLIREFMKQERLLTVEEAKEAGMVDHIIMPGDPILNEIFKMRPKGGEKS